MGRYVIFRQYNSVSPVFLVLSSTVWECPKITFCSVYSDILSDGHCGLKYWYFWTQLRFEQKGYVCFGVSLYVSVHRLHGLRHILGGWIQIHVTDRPESDLDAFAIKS